MTRISQRHFRVLSPVHRGRLIYDCCADNSSCYVVAQAASAIKRNFARACLQAQQLQAQSLSRLELQAALRGTRAFDCDATFAVRNFRHDPTISLANARRRALQLHPERRGRRAPSVTATAIATFQIITCLHSTWNTRDTCAHCARKHVRPTTTAIFRTAAPFPRSAVVWGKQNLSPSRYKYRVSLDP